MGSIHGHLYKDVKKIQDANKTFKTTKINMVSWN